MTDRPILMVPAHTRPPLSERHAYWIVCAVLLGIIILQWGAS